MPRNHVWFFGTEKYVLCSSCSQRTFQKGGVVCVYVYIYFLEICALKIETTDK